MANFRIETPVKGASTDLGEIHFHNGVAEVDDIPYGVRQYCEHNGYAITDLRPSSVDEPVAEVDDDNDPTTAPRGNASAEVWREHVLAIGGTEQQVADLNRDQLRELATQLSKGSDQQ